jgi:hypothetical protein
VDRRTSVFVTATVLVLLVAGACGPPPSPEEQVSELRSTYTAELNGFVISQEPVEPAASEEGGEQPMAEEAAPSEDVEDAGAAAAEGEMAEDEMAGAAAVRQDALLDILVSTTSRETLSGLTVDVTQADPDGDVKQTWRVYLDTADVHRGPGTQITYRLEGVDFREGDGFNVQVRHPVPPGERSDYREFQEYSPEG